MGNRDGSTMRRSLADTPASDGFILKRLLSRVPAVLWYTVFLFVVTRLALTVIGILSHIWSDPSFDPVSGFFSVWAVWDSEWYIDIATNGYSTATNDFHMANYAFFPLYPLAMKLLAAFTGDLYMAGIIISNACLLIASVYLFKLVRLDSDEKTALRSIKYMFLFPTAFILSGLFTESMFLALTLACFYYAKKGNWYAVGVLAFMTALSRPPGAIIILPLLYIYFKNAGFKLSNVRGDIACISLAPIGTALYAACNYVLTGDFLAFAHIQSSWGAKVSFPVIELVIRLFDQDPYMVFGGLFSLVALAILVLFYKKTDFSYWLMGMLLILVPLFTPSSRWSMPRYILPVFPLFIIFAKLAEDKGFDRAATIILACGQALIMTQWTLGSFLVI